MKIAKIVSVWSGLMFSCLVHGMAFKTDDRVQLYGPYAGEAATVYFSFAQMWPGDKIRHLQNNSIIASYLKVTSSHQPIGIEKYLYSVHVGTEILLIHQSWMRKIPAGVVIDKKKQEQGKVAPAAASATATAAAPAVQSAALPPAQAAKK